jgi:cold shock CspA family protein
MGRSRETYGKKEVRKRQERKKKDKEKKKLAKKENEKSNNDDMIAYVDEYGQITSTPPDPAKKEDDIDLKDIKISTPKKENIADEPIRKGVVVFFDETKGFGFIKDSETKISYFVHTNNLLEEIKDGNLVSFEIEMGKREPVAVRVKPLR